MLSSADDPLHEGVGNAFINPDDGLLDLRIAQGLGPELDVYSAVADVFKFAKEDIYKTFEYVQRLGALAGHGIDDCGAMLAPLLLHALDNFVFALKLSIVATGASLSHPTDVSYVSATTSLSRETRAC